MKDTTPQPTTKTARQWIEECDEKAYPWKSEVLDFIEKYPINPLGICDRLSEALLFSFEWAKTGKPFYWNKIHEKLDSKGL